MTKPTEAPDETTIATMAARIAELEAENDRFQAAKAVAAPQGQDTQRKNTTEKLVQLTRSGNVRTTIDPSLEFVAEQDNSINTAEKDRPPRPPRPPSRPSTP